MPEVGIFQTPEAIAGLVSNDGKRKFSDFNNLLETFASADYVVGLMVFNIGGNKYRLIASIHYKRRKVYVRNVLTHAEYNRET